jgi:hypothetical protein
MVVSASGEILDRQTPTVMSYGTERFEAGESSALAWHRGHCRPVATCKD